MYCSSFDVVVGRIGIGQSGMTSWIACTATAGALKSGELETTPPFIVQLHIITCPPL